MQQHTRRRMECVQSHVRGEWQPIDPTRKYKAAHADLVEQAQIPTDTGSMSEHKAAKQLMPADLAARTSTQARLYDHDCDCECSNAHVRPYTL